MHSTHALPGLPDLVGGRICRCTHQHCFLEGAQGGWWNGSPVISPLPAASSCYIQGPQCLPAGMLSRQSINTPFWTTASVPNNTRLLWLALTLSA